MARTKTQKPEETTTTELATEQDNPAGLTGEWGNEDCDTPRLQVVAKTSDLVDEGFDPGAVILSKEVTVALKDKPIDIIVVNMDKRFKSDVPFGGEEEAVIFKTLAEAVAAGYSTEWESKNRVRPMSDMTMLIKAPKGTSKEDLDGYFPYKNGKDHWAMCIMTAQKTAFKSAASPVVTYLRTSGAEILGMGFTLHSTLKSGNGNSWFNPIVKRGALLDAKTKAFVAGILG
jgi:hypothetical protein|tara:strand:- start:720 stop:1409 length:690 start_codon:yes stop_codon:yes gene_type:complete